jgi:hypothetical protein
MDVDEIRKFKQSALNALKQTGLDPRAKGEFMMAAAMWEIALQIATLNDREAVGYPGRVNDLSEIRRAVLANAQAIRANTKAIRKMTKKSGR